MLQNVSGDVVVVFFPDDFIGLSGIENFAEALIVGDVLQVGVFDEIDKARKVVEDRCEMVLDLIFSKKSVVLHGDWGGAGLRKTSLLPPQEFNQGDHRYEDILWWLPRYAPVAA